MAEWLNEAPSSRAFEDTLAWLEKQPKGLPRKRLQEMAGLFNEPRGVSKKTSAYQAQRLSDDFQEYYHHAAPFRGDALVDTWQGCREGQPSEASCREHAENVMLSSSVSNLGFQERVERCLAGTSIGNECQAGSERARVLVEEGARAAARLQSSAR